MFILTSFSSGLEFGSVNYTLTYTNFEIKAFKNMKILGEISNN